MIPDTSFEWQHGFQSLYMQKTNVCIKVDGKNNYSRSWHHLYLNFDMLYWNIMVQELQKTYPNWTSTDLLNLWHLFEQFDANGDRLLDFKEFNACIDLTMNSATPEQRKAMFTEADVHKYNCLNFEDFLQLMHNVRVGSPVPRTPEPEAEHDPDTQGIISDVSRMDTFQQMCYGLF
uniref:Si:ch211-122l24.6 n=1 Tax=Electrophorus electricus TaxID=8005 RepID=A0AAY5ELV1_ELEEL